MIAALIDAIRARLRPRSRSRRKRTVFLLSTFLVASALHAQSTTESPIQDNSFLIEEAYNQEAGIVQHVQTFGRPSRGADWAYNFSQEWPVHGLKHQLSYSIPLARIDGEQGAGDVALNYRYQWIGDGDSQLAVAPRATLLIPTGSRRRGLGSGSAGLQLLLPVSLVVSPRIVVHWNLGGTLTPAANSDAVLAGQGLVWLATQRINALVETLWTRTSDAGVHQSQFIVSPGVRWSYDLPGELQIVPGVAFPVTFPDRSRSVFLYLSFEHPIRGRSW